MTLHDDYRVSTKSWVYTRKRHVHNSFTMVLTLLLGGGGGEENMLFIYVEHCHYRINFISTYL